MAVDAEHRPLVDLARTPRAFDEPRERRDPQRNEPLGRAFPHRYELEEETMARGLLLWLVGVPIPVIILLWLFFGH
jgi:hypothetical protein